MNVFDVWWWFNSLCELAMCWFSDCVLSTAEFRDGKQ